MKTTDVGVEDLRRSVLAVPPLARNDDFGLNAAENGRLIRHLEAGGVSTLLYGGNANFYHIPLSEYPVVLDMLEEGAAAESWVIPSIGPDFGRMMDQARILRERRFPVAMVLPMAAPATAEGVETGIARAAEAMGRPVIVYVKSEGYLAPAGIGRLVREGHVCGIKYAIERRDPGRDEYLRALIGEIGTDLIISGMGERPAVVHLREFGLAAFTSGSVCVAPKQSMAILAACRAGDFAKAEALRAHFLPLEDLRDGLHQIRVLHEAVTLAGIGAMGPVLPLLSNIEAEHHGAIRAAARALLARESLDLARAA